MLIIKGSIMYSAGEVFIFCSDVRCCIKESFICWSKHCKVCVLKRGFKRIEEYAGLYLFMMHDDIC